MGGPDNGQHTQQNNHRHLPPAVSILSSGFATGSCFVPSEEVDRAFGMSIGKLRHRAGIESVRYASESEDESTLAATALQSAFADANCSSREIDWLLATNPPNPSADTAGVARAGLPVITLLENVKFPFSTPCSMKTGTLTST